MPIFPETLWWLHKQRIAHPKSDLVVYPTRTRRNMREAVLKAIYKLGLTPWPRLYHSLRASCETDLMRHFPPHVVCSWIGNSIQVAHNHYLLMQMEDLQKAKTQKGLFSRSGPETPEEPGRGLSGGVGRPPLRLQGDAETA